VAGPNSELVTLLEREAAAERDQVLAEARVQAEALLAEARRQAEAILADARARLDAEQKAALVKAQSTAQLHAASLVLRAKEEEIARIFASAEVELAKLPGDHQRYPAALRMFVEEALRGFPGRAVVSVSAADEQVVQGLARLGVWDVQVRADPSVQGGCRVATPDGRFVVTNTLASRLARARPALAAEVARLLWE
jgi:V/A-type H+-transporting ATPase subunit E